MTYTKDLPSMQKKNLFNFSVAGRKFFILKVKLNVSLKREPSHKNDFTLATSILINILFHQKFDKVEIFSFQVL